MACGFILVAETLWDLKDNKQPYMQFHEVDSAQVTVSLSHFFSPVPDTSIRAPPFLSSHRNLVPQKIIRGRVRAKAMVDITTLSAASSGSMSFCIA